MPTARVDPVAMDADAAVVEGIRLRFVDPHATLAFAQRLGACAADVRLQAYGRLFAVYGHLARGDRAAAEVGLAAVRAETALADDANALALASDLQAALHLRDGRFSDALQICEATLAQPEEHLSPWTRQLALYVRTSPLESLGRHDDALRAHYESLAHARRIGAPELVAAALGGLGGLQSSLSNLDDALPLCNEAWSICEHGEWFNVILRVGVNRMAVLSLLNQHDEAVRLANRMIALEERFTAALRPVRQAICAMALARAGQLDPAQALLDAIRSGQSDPLQLRAEWVWVQALIFNERGRPADALALLEPYIARHRDQLDDSRFPMDREQLFTQAARAHEALGEFAAALYWEREAATSRLQAASQSAHARRLTMQIGHDLDAALRARDDALRERERAMHEQARLAALNDQLEAANAAKTRFLAAASHDLRQPVQSLAMYLAALEREPDESKSRALVGRMGASLQSLAQLFDALLDLSQLDAGLVPLHCAPLRLDALLRRLVDEHQIGARARGLQLRFHQPRGLRAAMATSDAALLERCLRNLIDNALKYTARGGCVVRLREAGPQRWRIEVRDTGPGVAAAQQALVFEEFFQIGNDERDRRRGLGLGLSIVKRTAALLQHPIGLRSRQGAGSCFWIELPRRELSASETPDASQASDESLGLVVIDDDAQVRDALVALLERWGHRVLQAAEAADVLALWHGAGRPALHAAIVDLRLRHGRTGLQAIAELHEGLGVDLPALVLTGDVTPERLKLLADAGQPWLQKPVMPLRLRSWLQGLTLPA